MKAIHLFFLFFVGFSTYSNADVVGFSILNQNKNEVIVKLNSGADQYSIRLKYGKKVIICNYTNNTDSVSVRVINDGSIASDDKAKWISYSISSTSEVTTAIATDPANQILIDEKSDDVTFFMKGREREFSVELVNGVSPLGFTSKTGNSNKPAR